MSKGPGWVEDKLQAILEAAGEEAAFPVQELGVLIYKIPEPGLPEKQHRLAVVRAANNIIRRGGNYAWAVSGPGRGRHKVLYVPDNVVAYAKARLLGDALCYWWDREGLQEALTRYARNMQPGGAWWRHVEILKAQRCGDQERVAMLKAESEAELAALAMRLRGYLGR
jgi:hypothetical protein